MLPFCGQDKCVIDANGRLKLSPRLIEDFAGQCNGDVVLYCLPEGAVAVYPEAVFTAMRAESAGQLSNLGGSLVRRREMRRFGAMTQPDQITRQGRLTIPVGFRDYAALQPGTEVYVVGVEVGAEIWNAERWKQEMDIVNGHLAQKGAEEMTADLQNFGNN